MSDNGDDSDWLASEDVLLLRELLLTPKPKAAVETLKRRLSWTSGSPSHSTTTTNEDARSDCKAVDGSDCETMDEAEDEEALDDKGNGEGVVVIALRRQVQLLQQEYDRHLEQNVARSVVKAGGKTAPRAATIKLYRTYERLSRVAQELAVENQRLLGLLRARQRDQEQWLQSKHTAELEWPFRAVSVEIDS